jgi:transposase
VLYERLIARGKPKKVALIAVANKLLRQIFAILRSGIPYDPHDLERKRSFAFQGT